MAHSLNMNSTSGRRGSCSWQGDVDKTIEIGFEPMAQYSSMKSWIMGLNESIGCTDTNRILMTLSVVS